MMRLLRWLPFFFLWFWSDAQAQTGGPTLWYLTTLSNGEGSFTGVRPVVSSWSLILPSGSVVANSGLQIFTNGNGVEINSPLDFEGGQSHGFTRFVGGVTIDDTDIGPLPDPGSGNLHVKGNIVVDGSISGTFSGGVSGSSVSTAEADIRHTAKTWTVSVFVGFNASATPVDMIAPTLVAPWWIENVSAATNRVIFALEIPVGETFTTLTAYTKTGSNATLANRVWSVRGWKNAMNANVPVQVGSTATGVGGVSVFETVSVTGLSETVAAGTTYFVEADAPPSQSGLPQLLGVEAVTTRP